MSQNQTAQHDVEGEEESSGGGGGEEPHLSQLPELYPAVVIFDLHTGTWQKLWAYSYRTSLMMLF